MGKMNNYTITRTVKIDMPSLHIERKKFSNAVKKILDDVFVFKFDKSIGYIISIQSIDTIGPIHLDYKGFGYTTIQFKVRCLNPKKEDILELRC